MPWPAPSTSSSAYNHLLLGRRDLALEAMVLAADLAAVADDPLAEIDALEAAVGFQLGLGDPGFEQTVTRMLTVAGDPRAADSAWRVHWRNGRLHLYADRLELGHSELTKALRLAETHAFSEFEKIEIRMWIAVLMARWVAARRQSASPGKRCSSRRHYPTRLTPHCPPSPPSPSRSEAALIGRSNWQRSPYAWPKT